MRLPILVLAIALSFATSVVAQPSQPAPPPVAKRPPPPAKPTVYAVDAIHGFLYFHDDGSFGTKDLTAGDVALWNTVIGEGDAGKPSSAMLVQVDVIGPSFSNIEGKLTVVAKVGKKTVAKQTFALGDYFHEHGTKITVPMLVVGVNCDPVAITATLSGKGLRGTKTASVPFNCGE